MRTYLTLQEISEATVDFFLGGHQSFMSFSEYVFTHWLQYPPLLLVKEPEVAITMLENLAKEKYSV